jgi:hypothetical protein
MLTEGISVATTVTVVFKKKKSRLPIYLTLAWGKCIIVVFLSDFVSLSCLVYMALFYAD